MIPLSGKPRRQLVTFLQSRCVRTTTWDKPFTFASGEQGIVKFDLDPVWENTAIRDIVGKAMAAWMLEHAPETTLLGGPASAGPKVVKAMMPFVPKGVVRRFHVPKVPGERRLDERLVMRGSPAKPEDIALIVDDVGRKGTSILGTWRVLQQRKVPVLHALVVLDRPEGIAENLAHVGIQYHAIVERREMGVEDLLTTPHPSP